MSQVISDLLAIPDLKERASIIGSNPEIRGLIEQALEGDSDYQSADNNGKVEIRSNLGFPAPTPGATQLGFSPNFSLTNQNSQVPTEIGGTMGKAKFTVPTSRDYFASKANAIMQQGRDRLANNPIVPPKGSPEREAALMRGEIPLNITNIPAAVQGMFEQYLKGPLVDEFFSRAPDAMASKIGRGVVGGIPGLSSIIPEGAPHPEFFSVENAARVATDMLVLSPLFATGIVGAGAKVAAPAFQFLLRYPGLARATAEAVVIGGTDAGYRAFVKGTNSLLNTGQLDLQRIKSEFGPDFGSAMLFGLGFAGVASQFAGPKLGDLARSGFNEAGAAMQSSGIIPRVSGSVNPSILQAAEEGGVPRELLEPFRTRTSMGLYDRPFTLEERTRDVMHPQPAPLGGMPTSFDAAVNPAMPGMRPQRPQLALPGTVELPGGGALVVGKKPFTLDPVQSKAFDDVARTSKIEVKADGSMDFTIAEPVLKQMFVDPERAIAGDIVYWTSKQGKPQVGRVLTTTEDGVSVLSENGQNFIKREKLGTAKKPFEIDSEVYAPTGEPLTVKGYTQDGKVWVQGVDGKMRIEQPLYLRSYEMQLHTKAQGERTQAGIPTPEPEGTTVFDVLINNNPLNEKGAFIPGKAFGPIWRKRRQQDLDDIAAGRVMPIAIATQPSGKDMGAWRYFLDPIWTLTGMSRPEYDLGVKMMIEGKAIVTKLDYEMGKTLLGYRQMLGDFTGNVNPNLPKLAMDIQRDFYGANKDISERLARFALGVPKPNESMNPVERVVLDNWNSWVQAEMIPMINAKRALFGQQPVPPDYNWGLQLFPELVLHGGYKGLGLAEAVGKSLRVVGVDNQVEIGGVGGRLTTSANFWELAKQAMRWVTHEKAWRDPITYFQNLSKADPSSVNKKYLQWLSRNLDGQDASPMIADISEYTRWVDKKIMDIGGKYTNAVLDLDGPATFVYNKAGKSMTLPQGERRFDSPVATLAERNLGNMAMTAKQFSYSNGIGLNLRTTLLNLTQPWTHTLPQLPGNPLRNAFDILEGQVRSLSPLFSKKARDYYRDIGVLHDVEEIFTAPNVTHITGTLPSDISYGAQWLLNQAKATIFYGMRASEISNRFSAYYAMKKSVMRRVENSEAMWNPKTGQWMDFNYIMKNDPAFMQAIERSAVNMANISNFLYGRGFKSPIQTDLGVSLDNSVNKARSIFAPLGEWLYQYNTFSFKTVGMVKSMQMQAERAGGQQPIATRLAAIDGPEEFGEFLKSMKVSDRYAYLRYMVQGTAVAALVSAGLGINSLFWQMMPIQGVPYMRALQNPMTPVLTGFAKAAGNFAIGNVGKGFDTLKRSFTPAPLAGSVFNQRWERGNSLDEKLFKTRSDIEGTKNPFAPDDISEQFGMMFGGPSGRP